MRIIYMFNVLLWLVLTEIASSALLECPNAFDCRDGLIQSETVNMHGYRSASGANTTIECTDDFCSCNGAYSCHNVLNISFPSDILCYGTHSCSNLHSQGYITSNKPNSRMWCSGTNSCSYSIIRTTKSNSIQSVYCYGFLSCAHSQILGVSEIYAAGAYSLRNVSIDSEGITNNILKVLLHGYNTGLYTHIMCQSNHECNIICSRNGCNISQLHCFGYCTFDLVDNYDTDPTIAANIDAIYYFLKDIAAKNDEECNNESMSVSFDDDDPFTAAVASYINKTNICCRGFFSCFLGTIYSTKKTQRIIASGGSSLEEGILHESIGPLFCSGCWSCVRSSITKAFHDIYCLGSSSCEAFNINVTQGNIVCFGTRSCHDSVIHTSDNGQKYYFYFTGEESAKSATIYCKRNDTCIVSCTARYSCIDSTVICDGVCDIHCNSNSKCPVVLSQQPTLNPTLNPTDVTFIPTLNPTLIPTLIPTQITTVHPTVHPTSAPIAQPTIFPTLATLNPTSYPTYDPNTFNPSAHFANPTLYPLQPTFITLIITSSTKNNARDDDDITRSNTLILVLWYGSIAIVTVVLAAISICIWKCFVNYRKRSIQILSEMNKKDVENKAKSMDEHRVTDESENSHHGEESCVVNERGEGSMCHDDVQKQTNITNGSEVENIQADEFVIKPDGEYEFDTIQ